MGIDLTWSTNYPAALDGVAELPTLGGTHNIRSNHVNTLANIVKNLEAKVGADDSAVTTSLDYTLKKGRHTSKQPGGGAASVAYILDTQNAHLGSDVLVSVRSAGVERFKVGGGGADSTYLELDNGATAAVSASGKGRIRYNHSTGKFEVSVNAGSWITVATDPSGGPYTLDDAYDAGGAGVGRTVTVDADAVVFTTPTASGVLVQYVATDDGATGPIVEYKHLPAASNDLDIMSLTRYIGKDSAGAERTFASHDVQIVSRAAGATAAFQRFYADYAGNHIHVLTLYGNYVQVELDTLAFDISSQVNINKLGTSGFSLNISGDVPTNQYAFKVTDINTTQNIYGVFGSGQMCATSYTSGQDSGWPVSSPPANSYISLPTYFGLPVTSAATQAPSGKFQGRSGTWSGAAEVPREWDIYAGVTTAFDESVGVVSRLTFDYEQQNVLELMATSVAPGAASGVVIRNRVADGVDTPAFRFRMSANLTEDSTHVHSRWEDNDSGLIANRKMELTGNGVLHLFSAAPTNDAGIHIRDTTGVLIFALLGNNGRAQFQSSIGFEIYSGLAAGSVPLARIRPSAGSWGAGQPLFDICRDGTPTVVYQIDGDALTTWTARTTATGVELQTYRDDGSAGAADETLAEWTGYGKDSGNAKQQFTAIRHKSHVVTAGGERGSFDFYVARGDGQMGRMFTLEGDTDVGTAGETGFTFRTRLPTSVIAAMSYVLAEDSATVGPTFNIGRERTATGSSDGDELGRIIFGGTTSAGPSTFAVWAQIIGYIIDSDSASKDGGLRFRTFGGNTQRTIFDLFSPSGEAVFQNFRAAGNVNFELKLEENSATLGPILSLFRSRTNDAADGDLGGALDFEGMDDGTPTRTLYGRMGLRIIDSGDGSEDGALRFSLIGGGTFRQVMDFYSTVGEVVLENSLAAGTTAAYNLVSTNDFGAGQPLFRIGDTGGIQFQVDGDGDAVVTKDIEAVGGYKHAIAHWAEDNIVSSQTNNPMDLWAVASGRQYALPAYAGSVVGIRVRLSAALGSGTLTVKVRVNDVSVFTVSLTSADGTDKVATQAKDTDQFAATDRIDVVFDTDTISPSGSIDVSVSVYTEQ